MAENQNRPRFITMHKFGRTIRIPLRDAGIAARREAQKVAALPGKAKTFAVAQKEAAFAAVANQNPTDIAGHVAALSASIAENLMAMALDKAQRSAEEQLVELSRRHEHKLRGRLVDPLAGAQKFAVGARYTERRNDKMPEIRRPEKRLRRDFLRETVRRHMLSLRDDLVRKGIAENSEEFKRAMTAEAAKFGARTEAVHPTAPVVVRV